MKNSVAKSGSAHASAKVTRRFTRRDPVSDRRLGESTEDVRIACHVWLLKHDPSYLADYNMRIDYYNRTLAV